jgi:hypothetical protein
MKIAFDKKVANIPKGHIQLRTPLTQYKTNKNLNYILDNGCFSNFKEKTWLKMVKQAILDDNCLFFTLPDEVGSHKKTLELFKLWQLYLENELKFSQKLIIKKSGFVLQDGATIDTIPFDKISSIFLGGTTQFKMSLQALKILQKAKSLNKYIHIGRVNTISRAVKFHGLADSIDGSGLSKYKFMQERMVLLLKELEKTNQMKIC